MNIKCTKCNRYRVSNQKCEKLECNIDVQFTDETRRSEILPVIKIGLAGGPSAGKTYYLVNLIARLTGQPNYIDSNLELFLKDLGIGFSLTNGSEKDFNKLLNQIQSGKIDPTIIPSDISIVEPYQIEMSHTNNMNENSYRITFFNSGGEIYSNPEATNFFDRPDARIADAMIAFIDPKEDTLLNSQIPIKLGRSNVQKNIPVVEILAKLRGKVENHNLYQQPIAVVISKFDLLHNQEGIRIEQPFLEVKEISKDTVPFGVKYLKTTSDKIKDYLEKYSTTAKPKRIESKFNYVTYYAIAPIGHNISPTPASSCTPMGIYAPFFWILNQYGIEYGK